MAKAGLSNKVTFILGSILDPNIINQLSDIDAVFIDPDWAVSGPYHKYRFIHSNTIPPADILLNEMFKISGNVALVLPPLIDIAEFNILPMHERERLFLGDSHELFCLYFGNLMRKDSETEFRVEVRSF